MTLDRRNYRHLVETTVEMANKVGVAEIIERIVEDLKDKSEPYRRMVMETTEKVVANSGASDIDARIEKLLIEGILYAFQEQTSDDANVMLNGFGAVVNSLGQRVKPYHPRFVCQEEQLMGHLGVILFVYLGEEYPEVLGSFLEALKAIVNVIGKENCIDLVGRIADRGAEFVPAREWMSICFELIEMLKTHKKGIRRATVNTFGYIAKAIGPQDVLATLLNNLKVQERQNRVYTTVAIAIVAETCSPFTYIGEMGKYCIYAVTPLLEDALMDIDLVHRQTAASAVKHMALGVAGIEAIEGMRVALGAAVVLNYCLQGLFHPARKVREVYWKCPPSNTCGSATKSMLGRGVTISYRSMLERGYNVGEHVIPLSRYFGGTSIDDEPGYLHYFFFLTLNRLIVYSKMVYNLQIICSRRASIIQYCTKATQVWIYESVPRVFLTRNLTNYCYDNTAQHKLHPLVCQTVVVAILLSVNCSASLSTQAFIPLSGMKPLLYLRRIRASPSWFCSLVHVDLT
ncbi:Splicing factor 3B subunit 1 [Hibiscus syriacus]|uniref:Splicing factor 3B subunit 1 n=1 Tax=Hibiscus syriacus TaxID=106335 RepID=A0A6A3ASA9_HIBSY|nr:Splicing factor 3B subunit 1 [Hibiscus syriacus]